MNRTVARAVFQTKRAAKRSLIVAVLGMVWFLTTPLIFLWGLPQFGFYLQWVKNYGTNAGDVYLFWTLAPEVVLFFIGIFWAGGFFEMIASRLN